MNNPKFELFRSQANYNYYFHLRSENGEIVLNSEGYTSKQNCHNGIASVKINEPYDSRYSEIIGRSENYTSSSARENGIAAVKRDAPGAPIDDLS